jgi:NAD(P)H dehydrogenase (quinone)
LPIEILVLYYSRTGTTRRLAECIAKGIDRVDGAAARLRTVPPVAPVTEQAQPPIPPDGAPYAELRDLQECAGLALGSPTRFGNMAAPMKHFIDSTAPLWKSGGLSGKPAAVFTSTSTPHGGHESTLLSMMLPLLHHGMLLVGLPFTEPDLADAHGGGSPYGAGHVGGERADGALAEGSRRLAVALGTRLAQVALRLSP